MQDNSSMAPWFSMNREHTSPSNQKAFADTLIGICEQSELKKDNNDVSFSGEQRPSAALKFAQRFGLLGQRAPG
jgi:hypothetical protein